MDTKIKDYVIKTTAEQLGINENDVKLNTVIPNIQHMAMFACLEFNSVVTLSFKTEYTVEKAIKAFENQF
ncbi:hypothetical protein KAI92_03050 [Candidatus Parcubacteria bacterium]|nr:hypothetical protein [Candidatus Parcubacteria bacterium]